MRVLDKPYSEACEENKGPILDVIEPLLRDARTLLEIGSGTGQHAVCFAGAMPHLTWQTSDLPAHLPGIRLWLEEAGLPNLPPPIALDVLGDWPPLEVDAIFSANTAHIMSETAVAALFRGIGARLAPGGVFALYGPFNEGGRFTSDSNRRFDAYLRARDPNMGVRDILDLQALAGPSGLALVARHGMPVNNQTLVWRRMG